MSSWLTQTEEFGDCSSHNEFVVNTNRGIWTLRPSRLGLKFIVARGPNLKHVISEASRDLVWLRWLNTGQATLQSVPPLTNLRVLEVEEWFGHNRLQRLCVAECDAPLQLREFVINKCTELQGIPKSIGPLKQLRKLVLDVAWHFELRGSYQVKNIEGLHNCRELEVLKAHTRWEEAGIESVECMERLRTLHLTTAMTKSVVQSLQKCPDGIIVCTRAVKNAASIVNYADFLLSLSLILALTRKLMSLTCLNWKQSSPAMAMPLLFVLLCRLHVWQC